MRIVRRAVAPMLLTILGLAAIVWGALFHQIPVLAEKEKETTIEVPLALPPIPGADGAAQPDGMPFGMPTFVKKTIKTMVEEKIVISEPRLILDVSVGGVIRTASGELKRTYSGDAGPALCPT